MTKYELGDTKQKGNVHTDKGLLNGSNAPAVDKRYKDTVFKMIFGNRQRLLRLYNAMNHTDYDNPDDLNIVTLENAIYMSMRNDVGFLIYSQLHLYEHQSTINPNMPLRFLHYVEREYEKLVDGKELYREKQVMIPTPKFVVFYNGIKEQPERRILKLSDAYVNKKDEPSLELIVEVLNINAGYNEDIKSQCKELKEYSQYVECVRKEASDRSLEEAVPIAVDKCIKEGILKDFLLANKAEVVAMSIFEYDEEGVKELWRRDAFDDGLEQGIEQGIAQGISALIKSLQKIGMSAEDTTKELCENFELTQEKALSYIEKYWRNN